MHVEIDPRQYSVRVYENEGDINYTASCQVFVYGDVGLMYSINGRDFYRAFSQGIEKLREKGLKTLEGYVSDAHVKLLKRVLKERVSVPKRGMMAGREMPWVVVNLEVL